MTIERQAIYSGETRVVTDITSFAGDTPAPATNQAKTGSYAYYHSTNVGPFGKALLVPLSAIRLGFWLYLTNTTFQNTTILYFAGGGLGYTVSVNCIALELHSDTGEIKLVRPNASTGAPAQLLATVALPSQFATTGTWFHVGITHKVHATDGFLSIYINGVRVMNYEGDTRPSNWLVSQQFQTTVSNVLICGAAGTSGLQGFGGSSVSNAGAWIDDFFIDSYVDEVDAPVPSRRFLPSLPTGAGADNAWTGVSGANYANVDDNPNNGDTDYNKALAANLRDTFAFGDITLPVDHRIVAVVPTVFARRLDSEIAHKLSVHAWDGVQYGDSADLDLNMSYDVPIFARLTTQPDGTDWNEADFNAMQFGYRSRGTF